MVVGYYGRKSYSQASNPQPSTDCMITLASPAHFCPRTKNICFDHVLITWDSAIFWGPTASFVISSPLKSVSSTAFLRSSPHAGLIEFKAGRNTTDLACQQSCFPLKLGICMPSTKVTQRRAQVWVHVRARSFGLLLSPDAVESTEVIFIIAFVFCEKGSQEL